MGRLALRFSAKMAVAGRKSRHSSRLLHVTQQLATRLPRSLSTSGPICRPRDVEDRMAVREWLWRRTCRLLDAACTSNLPSCPLLVALLHALLHFLPPLPPTATCPLLAAPSSTTPLRVGLHFLLRLLTCLRLAQRVLVMTLRLPLRLQRLPRACWQLLSSASRRDTASSSAWQPWEHWMDSSSSSRP